MAAEGDEVEIGLGHDAGDDRAVDIARATARRAPADGRARRRIRRRCACLRWRCASCRSARRRPRSRTTVLVLLALIASSIGPLPQPSRPGKMSPAAMRRRPPSALEQQRAVLVEIEKAAVERRRVEAHPDRLAEPGGAGQPGRADRREAFVAPAPQPAARNAGRRPASSAAGAIPGNPVSASEVAGYSTSRGVDGEVDADADHDEIERARRRRSPIRAGCRRACAPCEQDVVRPFVAQRRAPAGTARRSASASASAATKPSCAARAGRRRGPQHQRDVEIARRRQPGPAAPAAPGGLLAGPDQRAVGRAVAGQRAWPRRWCCRCVS